VCCAVGYTEQHRKLHTHGKTAQSQVITAQKAKSSENATKKQDSQYNTTQTNKNKDPNQKRKLKLLLHSAISVQRTQGIS
jgi:hypothetical protein